jgi:formylglycine-generating enzyme required for sulfatase activity
MVIREGRSFRIDELDLPDSCLPLEMQYITAGSFLMGYPGMLRSEYPSEQPFKVELSQAYWLGRYPITVAQWLALMPNLPHPQESSPDYQNHPISWINRNDALAFCASLNARFEQDLPPSYRFTLPSEAQWEYACRAGGDQLYGKGDSLEDLSAIAWHKKNSDDRLQPVGAKQANPWGMHDMLGNLSEWCLDGLKLTRPHYPQASVVDWIGQADPKNQVYIMRSGSYGTPANSELFWASGTGSPIYIHPADRSRIFGLRLCLSALAPN